jgi:hypothetical protein
MLPVPEPLETILIADPAGKILALGIGGQEITELFRREIEVTVGFATLKAEI